MSIRHSMSFQSSQVPLGEALPTLHSFFHLFVCVCMFTYVPWCAGGGQRTVWQSCYLPSALLRQHLVELLQCIYQISWSAVQASRNISPVFTSRIALEILGLLMHTTTSCFLHGFWGLNWGQACTESSFYLLSHLHLRC